MTARGLIALRVAAIAATALYLVPTGAHLFEMRGKLALPMADYMVVQHIYSGWSFFGVVVVVALACLLWHSLLLRRAGGRAYVLSLASFLSLAATQAVFWIFTYPVNASSAQWTQVPRSFEAARLQWELSHGASALLSFGALVAIVLSVLFEAGRTAAASDGISR